MNLKDITYENGLKVCLSGIERNGHGQRHDVPKEMIGKTVNLISKDMVAVQWNDNVGINQDYYIEELQIYNESVTVQSILDELEILKFKLL